MRSLFILVAALTLLTTSTVQAQPAPGTTGVTAFGAKKADKALVAADDFRAMLGVCDEQREACEKDAVGVPFLAAAYMALWIILLAFLFTVRSGTARTRAELDELRARLRELEQGTS